MNRANEPNEKLVSEPSYKSEKRVYYAARYGDAQDNIFTLVIDESRGTGSRVRVLMESSDGERQWHTMGSSANIIEASWLALADSLEYWLLRRQEGKAAG